MQQAIAEYQFKVRILNDACDGGMASIFFKRAPPKTFSLSVTLLHAGIFKWIE